MVAVGERMAGALGRYRIVRQLGEGGMASAWLALTPEGEHVVLKIPLQPTPEMTTRLRDEAQAGRRVHHPHVVTTLDFFVHAHKPVLVIEYVDGCALRDLRVRDSFRNPLPAIAVAWLGRVMSEALVAIHEATDDDGKALGMLHRDVTASNILIGKDGAPKLIDLGIARSAENQGEQTQVGMLKGTLRYLAPELLLGEGYSPATDLWALGVSLFEAALGRQMVGGEPVDIFRALTSGNHRALHPGESLEPALKDALFALLADKNQRLRNARAAARMFAGVEARLGPGGQQILATLVPFAQEASDDDPANVVAAGATVPEDSASAGFDDPAGTVQSLARGPQSQTQETPPQQPTTVSNKVVIGGTAFGTAATLQMQKVDIPIAPPPPSPLPAAAPRLATQIGQVGPGSVGPTLILPAVDVPPRAPSLPMQGSIGPTIAMPAVDLRPPSPPAPSVLPGALHGAIGPTLVMEAFEFPAAPAAPPAAPPPPLDALPPPTLAMSAVDLRALGAVDNIDIIDIDIDDVLPVGAPTVQMTAWSPDEPAPAEPTPAPADNGAWADDTDRNLPRPASSPMPVNIGARPRPAQPSAPSSSDARPTMQLPIAALPRGNRDDDD